MTGEYRKEVVKIPKVGAKYCKIIDYINKGYLEYADTKKGTDKGWFIPHFLIICPEKLFQFSKTVFHSTYMDDSMMSKSNSVKVIKLYQIS